MRRDHGFRERLVLGPILRYLHGDEEILAWTHAKVPEVRAPGVLIVTDHHCLLHVASSSTPDVSTPLAELSGFELDRRNSEIVRVRLRGDADELDVEMSLTNRVRSRSVGRVLTTLTRLQVTGPETFDPGLTSPLPPMVRKARHHARRVAVTVLGVLVLLVSAVFASPFVPGPGALTAVAGIAILAREYEWARDLHVWASRQADRFLTWLRGLRKRRRARRNGTPNGKATQAGDAGGRDVESGDGRRAGRAVRAGGEAIVLEAEVRAPGPAERDEGPGRAPLAS